MLPREHLKQAEGHSNLYSPLWSLAYQKPWRALQRKRKHSSSVWRALKRLGVSMSMKSSRQCNPGVTTTFHPQHALPTLKAKAVCAGAGANRTVSEGWCDLEWETNGKIERPSLWAWSTPGAKAHLSTRLTVTDRFSFLITSSLGRLNSYSQSINGTISSYLYRVAHTRFQNPC